MDPCPISVSSNITLKIFGKIFEFIEQGHRYIKSKVNSYKHMPFVPPGEWRLDYKVSVMENESVATICYLSDFYEVK